MTRWLDWLFRDRETGRITIGQAPNLSLSLFAAASLAAWLAPKGSGFATASDIVARLALVWWGGDELLRGVNPWRRFLGAAALVALVAFAVLRPGGALAAASADLGRSALPG